MSKQTVVKSQAVQTESTTTVDAPETTVAKQPSKPVSGFAALLSKVGSVPDVSSKKGATIKPTSQKVIGKKIPELVASLLGPDGKPHPGAIMFADPDGKYGQAGCIYVCRFVELEPADHAYIHANYGEGNRDLIPARQKTLIEKMKNGDWSFVFNTIVFTVNEAGDLTGFEQHNGGHGGRAGIATNTDTLYLVCFGVPLSERDKIDDNAARSAKDIASTRTEIKDKFKEGTIIGGSFALTKQLAAKCKSTLTEALRIVDDVRHGKPAKAGGSRDKTEVGGLLDLYGNVLTEAIGLAVVLDSQCKTTGKDGKEKKSGGLFQRIPSNHAVAALTLAASEHDGNGGFEWNDDEAMKVLASYTKIAEMDLTDETDPMVLLRMTFDKWDSANKHKDGTGKNIRFACLKYALLADWNEDSIDNPDFYESITSQDCQSKAFQIGGIDDYVDDAAKRLEAAKSAPAKSTDPLPLVAEDDDEMTEETSDVPEEEEESELDQ